jgi:hypothetical protein
MHRSRCRYGAFGLLRSSWSLTPRSATRSASLYRAAVVIAWAMLRHRSGAHLVAAQHREIELREARDRLRTGVRQAEAEAQAERWDEFETSKREIRSLVERLSPRPI